VRASTALALACALVIAIALVPARAQEGDAKRAIYEAFSLVVEAHEAGGDVSELVEKLNKAIELLEGGDERGALELAEEAAREAPLVAEEGARRTREAMLLYVYVGNHMGRPMYYVVQVKVGDRETPIDPAPLEPVATFERVLLHNSTWIFPLEISFDEPGLNKRLIVELWIYNETAGEVQYHGKWCQLWINVTRP